MANKRIKVYLEGKCFDLSRDILERIPYIANMFDACQNKEETIYIKRSAMLFEHILAYVIDDTYLYPAQYEQELRFYGIDYKPTSLYHGDPLILERMTQLCDYTSHLDRLLKELFSMQEFQYDCIRCDNRQPENKRHSLCKWCKDYCATNGCYEFTKNQYCENHLEAGKFCNKKYCIWFRLEGSQYCIEHQP